MKKLTLERFENERQAGVKCVNSLCEFCMEKLEIVCDATDSSGDPSYANCLNYLPEKLIQGERSHTAAVASRIMEMVIPVTKKSITIAECDSLRNRIAAALQESGNSAMQQGTSHIADFPDVPTQYKQLTDDMTVTLAHYGDMVWGLVSELGCDNFECVGKRAKVIVVSATSA